MDYCLGEPDGSATIAIADLYTVNLDAGADTPVAYSYALVLGGTNPASGYLISATNEVIRLYQTGPGTVEGRGEGGELNGFGDELVHPCGQDLVAFAAERMGGDGDDRYGLGAILSLESSNCLRCLEAVEFGHLTVHQYDIVEALFEPVQSIGTRHDRIDLNS